MSHMPNDSATEELRIALVMNGGVSLAVWIGGVTQEIFRLITQSHPVYRSLLQMTNTTARVDVISGTSAGGINGAALALATQYGGNFAELRDVWLNVGAFDRMLRPPLAKNDDGSLLDGEGFFLPEILKAFESLASKNPPQTIDQMPIDLKLTATLLSGYQGQNTDDLGTALHDVDYRSYFHFRHVLGAPDDFADKDSVVRALARAARSTASFPFAFEPSLVPEKSHLRNYYRESLPTPRYVVDGGVLDNKPFRGAREGIFSMPRSVGVRRVLMYVNPDPGDGPAFKIKTATKDDPPMPAMSRVVSAALVGIPGSQSVADQLHEIKEHNEHVRTRHESVLAIAKAFTRPGVVACFVPPLQQLASNLFDVYRERRLNTTFDQFVYYPITAGVSRNNDMSPALRLIGKNGRDTLRADFVLAGGDGWLPETCPWPPRSSPALRDEAMEETARWQWGMFPVEFSAKVLMNMLRMIQSLADLPKAGDSATFRSRLPARQHTFVNDWGDPDVHDVPTRAANANADPITAWWSEAFNVIKEIEVLRERERDDWRRIVDCHLPALAKLALANKFSCSELRTWHFDLVDCLFADIVADTRKKKCAELAYRIAKTIQQASARGLALAAELAARDATSSPLRPTDGATVESLEALCKLLTPPQRGTADDSQNVDAITDPARYALDILLQLEVVEFAFNDHDDLNADTLIELVQVSGNNASELGGPSVAKEKLLGIQLAHFGAFYKESWRANDWTFGRLDGSSRLVDVLLDARRLHRTYFMNSAAAVADIKRIAVGDVPSQPLREVLQANWDQQGLQGLIAQELAFLDRPFDNLPDSLPRCAQAIKLRLHYGIAHEELPVVANSVRQANGDGAENTGTAQALLGALDPSGGFSLEVARQVVANGILAGSHAESFQTEVGSDLFTRTFAHTVATAQNTLSSKSAKLGPIAKFFAALRLPILGFHFTAQGLTRQSSTAAAVTGALLAVGLSLVVLSLIVSEMPAGVVSFGWLLLACGLFTVVAKAPRVVVVFLLVVAVALAWLKFGLGLPLPALLIGLLVVTVCWEKSQTPIAFLLVLLGGFYSWWKLPDRQNHSEVPVLAICIVVTLAMAYLQSAGSLAKIEKRVRSIRIAWKARKAAAAPPATPTPLASPLAMPGDALACTLSPPCPRCPAHAASTPAQALSTTAPGSS
ncbi:patatin-like protein [Variovorax rhizosphaerae]|uniref:Patatin-like protein n=1 Tax=Variovorax rhizosphaerae TaxID=1836200 RepID=A0ABU8WJ76_9BURK